MIRIAWTFNFDFRNYMLAGVIWVIGCCMILMAAAVHLPTRAIGAIGVAIIALHNIASFRPWPEDPSTLLKFLYYGGLVNLGESGPPLFVLYVIVPWIGVMMAGYAFGQWIDTTPDRRRTICLRLGLAMTALFILLRWLDVYGDPRRWREMDMAFGFLATTKYPASLLFVLMTLGPMMILLALAEHWRGRVADVVATFGRVPLFYYLLHIPVIHLAACIVSLIREGHVNAWLFGNHPMAPPPLPDGYRWSLSLLYLVFALCVIALYFPSRWFARLRAERKSAWLSYL